MRLKARHFILGLYPHTATVRLAQTLGLITFRRRTSSSHSKPMHKHFIAAAILATHVAVSAQLQIPSAKSQDDLRLHAQAYLIVTGKQTAVAADMREAAAEFKGHVLGYLDGALGVEKPSKALSACVRTKNLDSIVAATAEGISGTPMDRSVPSRFTLGVAVLLACERK